MVFGWFFWAAVIVAIVWLLSYLLRSNAADSKHRSPMEILKERFARGEISREEYEERRKTLIDT